MKIRTLSCFLLAFVCSVVFASTSDVTFDTIFVAPVTDISLYYLSILFGTVSNVLVGGSNMVVGQMFYVFNMGIITFTALLIFYTMTMSVINTAQDGNAMGQKVSTWIVLRIVTGMSLLVPTYSGFSAIQVLVMWSVVQGVGFADNIWMQALDTMAAYGGTVVVPVNQGVVVTDSSSDTSSTSSQYGDQMLVATNNSKSFDGFSASGTAGASAAIFASGMCAQAMFSECQANNPDNSTACNRGNFGFFRVSAQGDASVWAFGEANNTGTNGYSATMSNSECGIFKAAGGNNEYYNQALDNMVLAVGPMAMDFFSSAVTTCEGDSDKCDDETLLSTESPNKGCAANDYNDAYICSPSQMIISGASTYYSISMAARMNDLSASTSWMDSAKNAGWAMAGSYYYDLVGGGATTQLSLSPIVIPSVSSKNTWSPSTSNVQKPYYQIYSAMKTDYDVTSTDGTTTPLTTMAWYANAAYFYLQEMQNMTLGAGTGQSGTGTSNPQTDAYDEFTGLMIKNLVISSPMGNLSATGKSAYFGYTGYGDFTKYPGYIWNMLSSNLAALAGIQLFPPGTDLYPSGIYSAPGYNGGCGSLSNCGSPYTGCFQEAITKGCIYGSGSNPPFGGILGQASASAQSYLSDPLLAMAATGRYFLQNSMDYWTRVIAQTYSDAKDLAGAYMAANTATALGFSILAFWASFAAPWDVGGAFALMSGAIQAIAQFFFQLDRAVMESWLPFGTSLAMMFFMLGVMMGVYLPFVPFLLYLFGIIGWMISVVEAMVAAPLVAMGVTHPEGHDLLGKAEQSVMLLLGVFIRPAAMVIGLIMAITLNYIMIGFLNYGFIVTVNPILSDIVGSDGASFQLLIFAASMVVYVYVAIEVINQCFAMIFQVPDKLLRWIGGPQEQSSAAQAMNQIKGGVSQSAQGAGQGASSKAGSAPSVQGNAPQASTSFDQDSAGGGDAGAGKK